MVRLIIGDLIDRMKNESMNERIDTLEKEVQIEAGQCWRVQSIVCVAENDEGENGLEWVFVTQIGQKRSDGREMIEMQFSGGRHVDEHEKTEKIIVRETVGLQWFVQNAFEIVARRREQPNWRAERSNMRMSRGKRWIE